MSFVNPEYLFLLFLIPILLFLGFLGIKNFIKRKKTLINSINFKKLGLKNNYNEKYLSVFLWSISITLIIIAISRPIGGEMFSEVDGNNNDIVILLDLSDSMKARDVELSGSYSELAIRENLKDLSRFEASKKIIKGIIKKLNGEKISLVAFSDTAFPLSPLSNDYESFLSYLNNLDYSYLNEGGTDINNALEVSEKRFINKDNSKTLIIISDGEEHNEKALNKAKEFKNKSIKIISIGIGSKEGSKIFLGKHLDGSSFYKTYSGEDIITRLNSKLLKEISEETNGKYFEVGNENISQNITNFIRKHSTKSNNKDKINVYRELYQYFVSIAIFILIFEIYFKKLKI